MVWLQDLTLCRTEFCEKKIIKCPPFIKSYFLFDFLRQKWAYVVIFETQVHTAHICCDFCDTSVCSLWFLRQTCTYVVIFATTIVFLDFCFKLQCFPSFPSRRCRERSWNNWHVTETTVWQNIAQFLHLSHRHLVQQVKKTTTYCWKAWALPQNWRLLAMARVSPVWAAGAVRLEGNGHAVNWVWLS